MIIRNNESHGYALRFDYVLDDFADVAVLKPKFFRLFPVNNIIRQNAGGVPAQANPHPFGSAIHVKIQPEHVPDRNSIRMFGVSYSVGEECHGFGQVTEVAVRIGFGGLLTGSTAESARGGVGQRVSCTEGNYAPRDVERYRTRPE